MEFTKNWKLKIILIIYKEFLSIKEGKIFHWIYKKIRGLHPLIFMLFIATAKKICEPRYCGKDAVKQKAPTPQRHNTHIGIYKVWQHNFFLQISIQKFKLQISPLSVFTDKGIFS